MTKKKKLTNYKNRKGKAFSTLIILVAILLLVVIFLAALGIYLFHWEGQTAEKVYTYIPLPLALIDNNLISYGQYLKTYNSLSHFYQYLKKLDSNLEIPSDSELRQEVVKRLIKDEIAKKYSQENNIQVEPAEVDQELNQLIAEVSSTELAQQIIDEYYNLNLKEFKNLVLLPLYRLKKIEANLLTKEEYTQRQKELAQGLLELIKTNQATFEELAEKYNNDLTAQFNGDLGYFGHQEMDPAFEQVVFNLSVGEVSEVLKTQYGYHIIKVIERIAADPNNPDTRFNGEQIRASHIFIKNPSFNDWLEKEISNCRIIKLLNI